MVNEGNLYNIETSTIQKDRSKKDLSSWKKQVKKELMRHLADKSPEEVKAI